jgi:D-alanyl-D-alanine carboxypeptidase
MAALTPQQKPAYTPPQLSGAVPATHQAPDIAVALKHPPLPKPRPNVVLASLKMPPPDIIPTAKPRVRAQTIGQGDYSVIRPAASKPAAAKPAVAANNMDAMARAWTIQIGAFGDMPSAKAQLATYAEQSMDVLGTAERIVVPFQGADGQKRFRARFGPFAENEARQICARLTQRGQTCFAAMAN